ncbi:hypothetical protein [Candidatus Phytoplasma oryzae]|nr:hypothetical protein PIE28_01995 [Candidatus Phytoplasma oryzae]
MSMKIYGKHYEKTVPTLITLNVLFWLIIAICAVSYRYHVVIQQRKVLENIDIEKEAIKLNEKIAEENDSIKESVNQLLNHPVEVVRPDGTKEYFQSGSDENNNTTVKKIKVIQPDGLIKYFTPQEEIYKTVDQKNNIQIIETLNYPIKILKEKRMVSLEELFQAGLLNSVEEAKKIGLTAIELRKHFDDYSLYQFGFYDLKKIIKMYVNENSLEYLFLNIINKDKFFHYVQQKPLNSRQFVYFIMFLKKYDFDKILNTKRTFKEYIEAKKALQNVLGPLYSIFFR